MSSAPTFIRFEQNARAAIENAGLNWTAVEDIFLCLRGGEPPTVLLGGCPSASRIYQTREFRSLHHSLFAIKQRSYRLPCPWTGQLLSSNLSFTFDAIDDRLLFLPLIYRFESEGRSFWAVSCDLTGRLVHLFVPSLNLVIYELNPDRAKAIHVNIEKHLAKFDQRARDAAPSRPKIVAVIDMVTNYGHQMINHLSGIDLLDKAGMLGAVDEFWVCGTNFFGSFDAIFPELRGKLLVFSTRAELLERMLTENVLAVRVGANCFYEKTRARILRYALSRYAFPKIVDRFPIIAVTVRTGGRVCTNLDELIAATYAKLHPRFPSVGFIIDGWVFPETQLISQSSVATSLDRRFSARIREELAAAEHSFRLIPRTAIVRNLIGTSILDSIVSTPMHTSPMSAHFSTSWHFSLRSRALYTVRRHSLAISIPAHSRPSSALVRSILRLRPLKTFPGQQAGVRRSLTTGSRTWTPSFRNCSP
jgi:hypothetical protein